MRTLDLLRDRHGLNFPDSKLQSIVNTCAEIISMQEAQDFEDETRKAIDAAGGCSVCGDLDGYSCICEDEEDEEYELEIGCIRCNSFNLLKSDEAEICQDCNHIHIY